MQSTPIHINGPFVLLHQQGAHVICGRDGVPICDITGRLFDGSGRKDKYPDGVIRTETDRQQEAQWVFDAMQEKFNRDGFNPDRTS